MPKLLRAVRLDDSDDAVFRGCGSARDGEPVVTGGYAVCDFAGERRCNPVCHCEASFLCVSSAARCTIAEVCEVTDADFDQQVDALAWHLVKAWGAPSWEAARELAAEELRHTSEVCETLAPGAWITVKRERRAGSDEVDEQYSVYDRLMVGAHRV